MAESIGIVGGGALGSLLGAKLAKAGHHVLMAVRSAERRDAIVREGWGVQVADGVDALTESTLVYLCVKAFDTEAAALELRVLPSTIGVASLQNGWGNLEILERALPGHPLVAGVTALGAYLDASGSLLASLSGATTLAPWAETEIRWAEYAATLFESAGLRAETRRHARPVLWRKLVLNAGVNPLSAISGRTNGDLLASAPLLTLAESAAREAARVGIALGYWEPGVDPAPLVRSLLEETKDNRSSMAEDLARGRRTEIEEIVGSILGFAAEQNRPVPVLEALRSLILAAGRSASTDVTS
jgi:2-dehydropantoate 2-reductase